MKIAFVYDVIYPYVKGGVEKRIWELAVRLASKGHEVHIYGMKYWEGSDILRTREGVTLHGVCPPQNLYVHGRRSITAALRFSTALLFRLRTERFDITDCQQFPYFPCFSAKIVSVFKKEPVIITWHEIWGDYWYTYLGRAGIFGKIIELLVSRLTPNAIAVSFTTAEKLGTIAHPQNKKIIPNGVDLKQINSIQKHGESYDLIFAGRLIREKNADLLIRAMKIVTAEKPDCRLLIIGEGPEQESLRAMVRSLSLEKHVQMAGFFESHDEVIARIKSAKVCVLPSTREGFGIAALEALACGVPVVTVDHPANAIRELITSENGRISPLSAEGLAKKISELLELYPQMRGPCIASAAAFDWDLIVPVLESYYQSVLSEK